MSTATTQQQPPVIPPRPSRGQQERDQTGVPKIPPRPLKQVSNPDRYAPSPLNGSGPFLSSKTRAMLSANDDPVERSRSVEIPSVGEEGWEYAAVANELSSSREPSTSPTQTRTIADDLKMHAPKPSLPALSAKQRVMTVTRTDSDKAASFGIGKPSSDNGQVSSTSHSLKKKASTTSQLSRRSESVVDDDEHGIPEIGQQVPMYPNAGDVQAPSPAPGNPESLKSSHKRKSSSRGLPPGSYGLHGHGVVPQDKLDQKYYEKHPEALKAEHHPYQHDRPTDFSLSSDDLNKIVRDTGSRGAGLGVHGYSGTPSEQAGWQALEVSASRPQSTKPQESSGKHGSQPDITINAPGQDDVIHVEEPNRRRSVLFSDEATPAPIPEEESEYHAPILAEDEVRKSTPSYDSQPAMPPALERSGSAFEMDPPSSLPTSRPASLYKMDSNDHRSTPLENVEEYEPLFPEDQKGEKKPLTAAQIKEIKQRFPSRDIWEDAPNSVHYTAEVSTPEVLEEDYQANELEKPIVAPPRENETPAQAFARRQEELAEKEAIHPDSFLWRTQTPAQALTRQQEESAEKPDSFLWRAQKPAWIAHKPHVTQEAAAASRPGLTQRFPSRDVWEDTPDSARLETTVSTPQLDEPSPPAVTTKPAIPERPQPKSKPVIPERPKPQVPARPAKAASSISKEGSTSPVPKAKPAVPSRPAGNKIAALQAGFMSDLNKRLQIGPQAPKKDEPKADDITEEKEKVPLSDVRKGRARGPQRRAPAAASPSPSPAAAVAVPEKPKLSFAPTVTIFTIDPEEGNVIVSEAGSEPELPVEKEQEDMFEEKEVAAVEPAVEGEKLETEKAVEEVEPKAKEKETVEEKTEEGEVSEEKDEDPKQTKTRTLATNVAGETVAEATLEEDKDTTKVEPITVDTTVAKD